MPRFSRLLFFLFFGVRLFGQRASPDFDLYFSRAKDNYRLDSAENFAVSALALAKKQDEAGKQARAYWLLGKICNEKSEYNRAIRYSDSGLALMNTPPAGEIKAILLIEKARGMQLKKDYTNSLEIFLQALKLIENINDHDLLVRVNICLAEYYRNLSRYDDAVSYMRTAFQLVSGKMPSDKELLIMLNNRAAAIKSEMGDGDSSLYFSNRALSLSREIGNLHYQAVSLNEIGYVEESKEKLPQALATYSLAEEIWRKAGYRRYWVNVAENIARTYTRMREYEKSNHILEELAAITKEKNWTSNLASVYSLMSENYRLLNNRELHYKFGAMSIEASHENYRKENERQLEEVKSKYEAEKKEKLLIAQKKETEIANIRYGSQKKETVVLIYVMAAMVLLLCVIVYIAMQRSVLNKQLKAKNEEISNINKKLEASVNKTELLMKEVHHRVKNNLQIISSMFHLQSDSIDDKKMKDLLLESDNRVMMMATLHEKLYSQENLEKLEIKGFIEEIVNGVFHAFSGSSMGVDFVGEIEEVSVEMDKAVVIGIIINELVTNSIKHAFEKTQVNRQIKVVLKKQGQGIILYISDNGKGIPENFSFENSSSFGLNLVSIMVEHGNGKVRAENRNGTMITVEL